MRLLGLQRRGLGGLRRRRFLLGLVQLGGGNEDRQLGQSVFRGLVAGSDEDFGIEVRIGVAGDFTQLQGVLVAVVGDDMNVRRAVRHLRLDADKAAGDMAAIEDPIHRVAGEDVGNLLLGGSRMSVDCSRPARTTGGVSASDTVMVRGAFGWRCFASGVPGPEAEAAVAAKRKSTGDEDEDGWFHGLWSFLVTRSRPGRTA